MDWERDDAEDEDEDYMLVLWDVDHDVDGQC